MVDPVQQAALVEAIRALPERPRAVFMLHRFEGYSYGRIAAHLGVTARRVERDMAKALARLHAVTPPPAAPFPPPASKA